jgi:uncharacterized protein YqgV (UPF0045/DUF77 family)
MTATGFLTVSPKVEGSMAPEIAKAIEALETFDVAYETTPMGTILQAETAEELFAVAHAAHEAVDSERVGTFLKIDDKRTVDQPAMEKVRAVEEHLGREASNGTDFEE